MRLWLSLLIAVWLAITSFSANAFSFFHATDSVAVAELPEEARETLRLIRSGGPFPYSRDGIFFGNYEGRLPKKNKGYYREYTVPTPGRRDRGPRRIIAGADGEYYYTQDHYQSFRRIRE